ncbi:MAG: CoA-transferase [Lapillicoccus sp.]
MSANLPNVPKLPTEAREATEATRAEVCVVACADLFRGAGEILGSAFGTIPAIGVRLARATFAPDLMLSDGEACLVDGTWAVGTPATGAIEAWVPFRTIFDLLWNGRRHVVMVPSQVDRHGNANISAIGDYQRPTVQLLGVRGAPGNTVSHPTSYWVPRQSARSLVPAVDMVCGVGTDRAAAGGPAVTRHHDLHALVTDLAVFDFTGPGGSIRLSSVHPGVEVDDVVAATGFDLDVSGEVAVTRLPTAEELRWIRDVLDPADLRSREVRG